LEELDISFDWIDGVVLNTKQDAVEYINKYNLTYTDAIMNTPKGNLGVTFAWFDALKAASELDIDYALILEDDASPINKRFIRVFMKHPEIWINRAKNKEFIALHPYFNKWFGTHAQLITPACSKKLLAKAQIIFDDDVYNEKILDSLIISGFLGIECCCVEPYLFHQLEPFNDENHGERMKRRAFLTE